MIDVSDRIGRIGYPVQNPDRVQEIRKRREADERNRSNGKRRPGKRNKPPKEDGRLDTLV